MIYLISTLFFVTGLFSNFLTSEPGGEDYLGSTNLGGGEAPIRILLLCDPLHNV